MHHTLTAVDEPNGMTNGQELTRQMWVSPVSSLQKNVTLVDGQQGMYMFGGIDSAGKQTDELFWITMDFKAN